MRPQGGFGQGQNDAADIRFFARTHVDAVFIAFIDHLDVLREVCEPDSRRIRLGLPLCSYNQSGTARASSRVLT